MSLKGDRLADGAVRLASEFPTGVKWTQPGTSTYPQRRPFSEWLHSADPLPQAVAEFRQFMMSTEMNCYQWIILAALRSSAIDRPTAIRYYDGIFRPGGRDESLKALYGANQPYPVKIEFAQKRNERATVTSITGPGVDFAQKGDIMTFDDRDHVMAVTGKDGQGRLLVASFPAIPWGERAVYPGVMEAYLGTFDNFLEELLKEWEVQPFQKNENLIRNKEILVGTPAFI
jgi:hypothetical protein